MHFTYSSDSLNYPDLMQGDILKLTDEVKQILAEAHPYYNKNSANKFFIVLSQSCDLVRRSGKICKTRYITLAPVRALSFVLERELENLLEKNVPNILISSKLQNAEDIISRIINNNSPEYFYLHKEPTQEFPESCCVILRLSIAVRAFEHYETCLGARILSLNEGFRAKLGWLVGQLYSRVGTEDWASATQREIIKDVLKDVKIIWTKDKRQLNAYKAEILRLKKENPEQPIDPIQLLNLPVKTKKDEAIAKIQEILNELLSKKLSEKDLVRTIEKIKNNPIITALLE